MWNILIYSNAVIAVLIISVLIVMLRGLREMPTNITSPASIRTQRQVYWKIIAVEASVSITLLVLLQLGYIT